jgi:2-phosphoglycerate kinase
MLALMTADGIAQSRARRVQLRHVYWIGGGSGAGKSTVARRLAGQYGLRQYATDDVMPDHGRRITLEDSPFLAAFAAMDMDERWVSRSPETMVETFHWFRGEGFGLIVEDLLRLAGSGSGSGPGSGPLAPEPGPGVIAEGFRLLPRLVEPLLAEPGRAVWLLPTPGFRRAAFESRGSLLQIAGRTSDPDRALRNLLERDRMFTDRLRDEAGRLGLPVIEVDAAMTEDGLVERVAEGFGLVRIAG